MKRGRQRGKLPPWVQRNADRLTLKTPKHLMVSVAMHKSPNPKTLMAVTGLLENFYQHGTGHQVSLRYEQGSDIAVTRARTAKDCLDDVHCEGVLFIDDDMLFPVGKAHSQEGEVAGFNPLLRLLGRDKDIIGALCVTRALPLSPNAFFFDEDSGDMLRLADPRLVDPRNGDPFKVAGLGFGFIYVSRRAFMRVMELCSNKPLTMFDREFNWRYLPDAESTIEEAMKQGPKAVMDAADMLRRKSVQLSEDLSFCAKARQCGIEVWVDPSFEVQHIGDYGYSRIDWMAQQEARVEQEASEAVATE